MSARSAAAQYGSRSRTTVRSVVPRRMEDRKNSEITRPMTPTIMRIRPIVVISRPEMSASTAK